MATPIDADDPTFVRVNICYHRCLDEICYNR